MRNRFSWGQRDCHERIKGQERKGKGRRKVHNRGGQVRVKEEEISSEQIKLLSAELAEVDRADALSHTLVWCEWCLGLIGVCQY